MSEKILFVDDDARILNAFKRRLYRKYKLHTANDAEEGLKAIEQHGPFAVVISDQQMPGMDGITFLKQVMTLSPLTVRIMLTGNADRKTAVDSVNDAHVFHYINKPCAIEGITDAIEDGLAQHKILVAEKDLLEKTLSGSVKLLVDILAINDPHTFKQISSLRKAAKCFAKYMKHPKAWELDMTIMLSSIGEVVLPPEVRTKLANGEPLNRVEKELANSSPKVARDLLLNIPRLKQIAEAVYYKDKGYDGSGLPKDRAKGDEIPLNARIYKILHHLASASHGRAPSEDTFKNLEKSGHLFDPKLFTAAKECFLSNAPVDQIRTRELSIKIADLLPGDQLLEDLKTESGNLALAADNVLTEAMIQKVYQFHKLRPLIEPFRILRETAEKDAGQNAA